MIQTKKRHYEKQGKQAYLYRGYLIRRERHERLPQGYSNRALKKRLIWGWYSFSLFEGEPVCLFTEVADTREKAAEDIDYKIEIRAKRGERR